MNLPAPLAEFTRRATALWEEYTAGGPGSVDPATHAALRTASAALPPDLDDETAAATATLNRLLDRAAERPEGLSFVTGEAGLIPRREWHDAIESALATLRERSPH